MKSRFLAVVVLAVVLSVTCEEAGAWGGPPGPTAILNIEPISATAGVTEVTFDGRASLCPPGHYITEYVWDFGDGSDYYYEYYGNGDGIATHVYSSPGTYTVCFQVKLDNGHGQWTSGSLVYVGLPGVWYVNIDNVNGTHNGLSWGTAFNDLQDALMVAEAGDEIWVAEGLYTPGASRTDTFQLVSGVGMYGGFDGTETSRNQRDWVNNETILSGNPACNYHVVTGANGSGENYTILDGFTIKDGTATGDTEPLRRGAGMYNVDITGGLRIYNCIFKLNQANSYGGGMYNYSEATSENPIIIENCTFQDNTATNGGGAVYNYTLRTKILHCNFISNGSGAVANGGAICGDDGGPAYIADSFFIENSCGSKGGALYIDRTPFAVTTQVINCVFKSNQAENGGAIGWYRGGTGDKIINCTFNGNTATASGKAIYHWKNLSSIPYSLTVTNCILWDGGGSEYDYQTGADIDVAYCHIQAAGVTAPSFISSSDIDGADNIYWTSDDGLNINSDSPCIDEGDGDAAPAIDILGNNRYDKPEIGSNIADIGAYEYVP